MENNQTFIVEYLPKEPSNKKWRAYNRSAGLWSGGWSNTYSSKNAAVNAAKRKAKKGDFLGVFKKDGTKHYQTQV